MLENWGNQVRLLCTRQLGNRQAKSQKKGGAGRYQGYGKKKYLKNQDGNHDTLIKILPFVWVLHVTYVVTILTLFLS